MHHVHKGIIQVAWCGVYQTPGSTVTSNLPVASSVISMDAK